MVESIVIGVVCCAFGLFVGSANGSRHELRRGRVSGLCEAVRLLRRRAVLDMDRGGELRQAADCIERHAEELQARG